MGEHSAPENKWALALGWALRNKRRILAVAVVALPLVARYVPGFPADAVLDIVRVALGA